ncbi:MAG: hypothetical protein AAGG48_26715 [Planctomycetota bacterium]
MLQPTDVTTEGHCVPKSLPVWSMLLKLRQQPLKALSGKTEP